MFTGPHSYSASPVELLFAHFKADDINPRKLKTGKRWVSFIFMIDINPIFLF